MAARSIATLSLSFGLVSIPVKVYSATESGAAVHFNMLHNCGSRLKQQYVCVKEGVVVERGTHHELMAAVRQAGLSDLAQVNVAILETNGRINVIPKNGSAS